jgi:uncharacterized membrane protein
MERNVNDWERGVSIAAGALLVLAGLKTRGRIRSSLISSGAGLAFRGVTGYCPVNQMLGRTINSGSDTRAALGGSAGVKLEESVTIRRSARELFDMWHSVDFLPRIFSHIESVRSLGGNRTHWVMRGPVGTKLEWDAETINEVPDELIAWKSLEGADVVSAGSVHFREHTLGGAPETEVTVTMQYNTPVGKVGSALAWLAGASPATSLREDLNGLKQRLEQGYIGTASAH